MDKVDITDVPIGQTVVYADTPYIKGTFKRTSHYKGHAELSDPASGKVVMKLTVDMTTGRQVPTWFDWDFWTVKVDGKPVARGEGSANGETSWEPQTRTINIRTR